MTDNLTSGVNSIPAIHTTHRYMHSFHWPKEQSLREAWTYAIGKTEPHYPVPVHKYEVLRTHIVVTIFEGIRSTVIEGKTYKYAFAAYEHWIHHPFTPKD